MAKCMPFFGKLKQRLTGGAGNKAAAAAIHRNSEDAKTNETIAEHPLDNEQRQEGKEPAPQQQKEEGQEEKKEKEKREEQHSSADEAEAKEETQQGQSGREQQDEAPQTSGTVTEQQAEPPATEAVEEVETQQERVKTAESRGSLLPNAPALSEGEVSSAAAGGEEEEGAAAEVLRKATGSHYLEPKDSHPSNKLGPSDAKTESPLPSTSGVSSANPSSSAASSVGRDFSRRSSLGLRETEGGEGGRSAADAAAADAAADAGGSAASAAPRLSSSASVAAGLEAAAAADLLAAAAAAENIEAAAAAESFDPTFARRMISTSDALVKAHSGLRRMGTARVETAAAVDAAELEEAEAAEARMRRKGSLFAAAEGQKKKEDKSLQDVIQERDALSKQLEQTAAFYVQHIQRITDIYNSVVEKAQATEQKKNRYAEKLAELMIAANVGDITPRPAAAAAAPEGAAAAAGETPAQQQSVQRLQDEVEALRVEKQELEERVAGLVDRCAALQQALVDAGGLPPISSQFSNDRSLLSSQGRLRSREDRPRSSSSSSLQMRNEAGAGEEGGKKQSFRMSAEALKSGDGSPIFPGGASVRKKSSVRLGGRGIAADNVEQEEEEEEGETDEVLLQRPADRLFKGEETLFQELKGTAPQQQQQHQEEGGLKRQLGVVEEEKEAAAASTEEEEDDKGNADDLLKPSEKASSVLLSKRLSRKGVEAFLTEDTHDEDNSVLASMRSRTSISTLLQQPRGSEQGRVITALCCGRRTKKADLREMRSCSCMVCRHCLREALLSAKTEIRNFVGMDPATNGGATWKVSCPRCGCKQGVCASHAGVFSSQDNTRLQEPRQ